MNGEFIKATIRLGPRCNALRDEYAGLIWDDRANKREEHPASPNHCCFVAGAMVQTEHGPRAIESVAVGDLVWTRKGLRPVTAAFSVGERETWEAETSAGTLRGTADHPVWTQHGWVELQSLTQSCTLTGWDNTTIQRSSGGTASCGTDTPTPSSAATQVQTTYRSTALSAGGPSTETATPNPGAVPVRVRRVAPTGCVERVYNLTVADAHEYFANGVLVSNCDAALYAWRYCYQFMSEKPAPAPTASEQEDQWEAEDEERERAKEEEASLWQ